MMRLEWGEGDVRQIDSVEELDRVLDELGGDASMEPVLVELFATDGTSLAIGVGRDRSIVSYVGPSGNPPYFHSIATDEPPEDEDVIVFGFRGEHSEFPSQSCIPIADAREAARRFFTSSELPANLRWEQD